MVLVTRLLFLLWTIALIVGHGSEGRAQESSFPVPPGLEDAVAFWKRIFTQYGSNQVILFDPVDPVTVYSVLRAPDSDEGRAIIDKERARVVADYDLLDDETRIRTQRGAKEHFVEGLKLAGRYIEEMKKIFRAEGLPPELAYLPLVESSFNIRARSGAGAVGMWQFMAETGKKFMRIDDKIDERRDPFESTKAAARLLKENYRLLGSWPLAITAYNHGTDGIFRGIKAVESDDLVDLIRGYQSPTFGFASKNFYAEFLAVLEIAMNKDSYFPFLRTHAPMMLRAVTVKRQAPLHSILKPAAISQDDFFEWNPAIDPTATMIPVGYPIKLPPDKIGDFLAAERRVMTIPSKPRTMMASKTRGEKPPKLTHTASRNSVSRDSGPATRTAARARKSRISAKTALKRPRRAPVKLASQ